MKPALASSAASDRFSVCHQHRDQSVVEESAGEPPNIHSRRQLHLCRAPLARIIRERVVLVRTDAASASAGFLTLAVNMVLSAYEFEMKARPFS